MRTPFARRSLIAATTLAMVAVGAGIAGAEAPDRSDLLSQMNLSAELDLSGWDAADASSSSATADKADKGPSAKPDKGPSDKGKPTGSDRPGRSDRFTVDTTADTVDANVGDGQCEDDAGDCSLRAAVQEANAADTGVRINVAKGATYALTLTGAGEHAAATGDLDVTGDIQVKGDATIDASGLGDRVFDVAAGATLALDGPDLTGGTPPETESGGAIRTAGTTEIKKSTITDSDVVGAGASGGAIFNDGGDLAVKNSTLSGNSATRAGGAIEANGGTTELKDVELLDNATGPMPGNGGGLHLTGAGTVDVRDSIVADNTATAEGGGLWNSAGGTMTVDGTTLTGNVASGNDPDQGGGALFNDGGTLVVTDSTIDANVADGDAGSGGGILNNMGALDVSNTSITNNTSVRAGGGIEAVAGTTDLTMVDLSDNATGNSPGNGGGLHLTGAGEVDVTSSTVTDNTAASEGGGLWNSATGTMVVHDTTVTGNTASGDAADNGGGGLFNDGGTLVVTDSTISNNVADGASGSGGGILNGLGVLTIERSTLSDNTSNRAGGAIEAVAGTTTIDRSELSANATGNAPGNGGALHLTGEGDVTVTRSDVLRNTASAEGGGLWNSAVGTMTIRDTTIRANTASGNDADQGGGGLFNDGGTMLVTGSTIATNVADGTAGSGGGILNNLGDLTVIDTRIAGNTSNRAGGGIEAVAGSTEVDRSTMVDNVTGDAPGNGGALHLTGAGDVLVRRSTVNRNVAANEGGGLWNSASGTMEVRDVRFAGNVASGDDATNGGGALFNDGGSLTVVASTLVDNVADGAAGSGGGILNDQGTLSVVNTRLAGNTSNRAGGGIEANLGSTTLDRVDLVANTTGDAPGNGGGLHLTGAGTVDITRSRVVENVAAAEGGGLWNSASGTMTVRDTTIRRNQAPVGPNVFNDGGTFTIDGEPVPVG